MVEGSSRHAIYSPEEVIAELGGNPLVKRLAFSTLLPSLSPVIKVREPMKMVQEQAVYLYEEKIGIRDMQIIWRAVIAKEVFV